jgi:preprotein translocase SecE subunit
MKAQREEGGRHARMAAFWSLTLMTLFGCTFLHGELIAFESLAQPIRGYSIPIVGIDISGSFLISAAIFLLCVLWIRRWIGKPKVATMLVDTEAELRKVTWPSGQQVINSSLVVVVAVLLIGLYLAGLDYVLARISKYLVIGG